jgi:hypothetical protein
LRHLTKNKDEKMQAIIAGLIAGTFSLPGVPATPSASTTSREHGRHEQMRAPVSRPSEARGSRNQVKLGVDLAAGPEDSTRVGVETARGIQK